MTNPGTDLRPDWFQGIRINTPAVERRAATLPARRSLTLAPTPPRPALPSPALPLPCPALPCADHLRSRG